MAAGRDFYDEQIRLLEEKNIDGIVDHYHPEATLVGFDVTVKGRDALREHFIGYLDHLGSLKLISTDKFTETDDSIFFEATVETNLGVAKVSDVFVLDDGRATHHFTGVISVSPKE